jgi:hypothetical protein
MNFKIGVEKFFAFGFNKGHVFGKIESSFHIVCLEIKEGYRIVYWC